jgi:hypothetical protein
MNKYKFLSVIAAIICTIFSVSCTNKSESGSISDLVQHFKDNGFEGEFSPKAFALIGATDGGEYWKSESFSVEIYKFETPERAQEITKTMNLRASKTHCNGSFTMSLNKGDEKIIKIFNDFK